MEIDKLINKSMLNNKIDKENMRNIIIKSAEQLKEGLKLAKNIKIEGNFTNIIICGMGGSALSAYLVDTLLIKTTLPIYIHQDYNLPLQTNQNSLIICISYSGNTEETISALGEALKKNIKTVAISTGGKITSICQQNNIPLVIIPTGIQPRCATGYIFSALAQILINLKIIEDIAPQIIETSTELKKTMIYLEKEGKELAKKLFKKTPIIYASNKFKEIARILKIKFNENSKIPAFYNYFPELNHNEMVGYTKAKKDFFVIIIQDSDDHPRILKRMQLTAKLISQKGIKTEIINIKAGSMLFKIFSTLLLGDWASYYLALEYKVDPTPVKIVEEFKKLMRE